MPPTFADLGVPAHLTDRLEARGIVDAFPIQVAAIPDALAGRDIVGQASTGSGKTLAFGLPLVARLRRGAAARPTALVLTPTRELAGQIEKEIIALSSDGRRVLSIYGGVPYSRARRALAAGVDVVVACPGRLEDLLEQGTLSLENVTTVVVDEADRMADMGFLPAVTRIVEQTSPERQTMLFSATLGSDVARLVKRFTDDAVVHDVIDRSTPLDVDHYFWRVERDARVDVIADVVAEHGRAIVFTRTKHGADRLAKQLTARSVSAVALHGDRSQAQRDRALAMMSDGRVRALVATDVAARGIHIDDLPVVIHFDPPTQSEDYVHRSGRTGRAGAAGTVITLVTPDVAGAVKRLQRTLGLPTTIDEPGNAPARPGARPAPAPVPTAATESQPSPRKARAPRGPVESDDRARRSPAPYERRRPAPEHRAHRSREAVVTFFNDDRGFGFASDGSGEDLFIHESKIVDEGRTPLRDGLRITFDEVRGPRGREAHNVRVAHAARRPGGPGRPRDRRGPRDR